MLIDAHAHVQDSRLAGDLEGIIRRARDAGIVRIISCGTEEKDWPLVARLSQDYPHVIVPSFGLHPWFIPAASHDWFAQLEKTIAADNSAGIGEIGLDFALKEYDVPQQVRVLTQQLHLAQDLKRPVSLHCRKAFEALADVLHAVGPLESGGIIHSYSGSCDLIPVLQSYGLAFSFSGSITRANNTRGREALMRVPSDTLLIETDSPDILPCGMTGLNEPANISLVVKSVAGLLNLPDEAIVRITSRNAARIFRVNL